MIASCRVDHLCGGVPEVRAQALAVMARALIFLVACQATYAIAQVPVKKDGQWRYAAGAGVSVASGGGDARQLNLTADALRATDLDKWAFMARVLRATGNGDTQADQASAGSRYERDLSARWYAFGSLDGLRDTPANLDLRLSTSAGTGIHLLQTEPNTFDVFAGLGYVRDEYEAPTVVAGQLRHTYGRFELVLGEESKHTLTESTTFNQRFALFPNISDSGRYRAVFEAGIAVAIDKRFSLNTSLAVRYDSDPGTGADRRDLLFVTGLTLKFD